MDSSKKRFVEGKRECPSVDEGGWQLKPDKKIEWVRL